MYLDISIDCVLWDRIHIEVSRGFFVLVVCQESRGWRVSHGKRRHGYYRGSSCLLNGINCLV